MNGTIRRTSVVMGILMLAALGLIGLTDMHQMNGLKNVLAVCINGIAAAYFAFSQFLIIWSGNIPEETPWYLKRITGISPKLEQQLNDAGVFHFWQLADLDATAVHWRGRGWHRGWHRGHHRHWRRW